MKAILPLAALLALVPTTARPQPAGSRVGDPGAWERVVYGVDFRDDSGEIIGHPFLGGFNLPRPQLADADGDGDLDLFLQERSDQVMFFRNVSTGGAPEYRWVTDSYEDLPVGEWFRFVDVDLDGDLDLLAEEPYSYIRYYRNDGGSGPASYVLATDTLRDVAGEAIFSDRQNIPNAADIDCDGFLDLLIGRLTGTITRYEAETVDGDGVPRFRHITDSFEDIEIIGAFQGSLHGANTMALGDVDQDGDHDLFWGDFFEPGLLLIENTGTCRTPVLRGTPRSFPLDDPVTTSGYNAPALGDFDRDGDMDLTMGVLGGAFDPKTSAVENLYQFEQGADGEFRAVTSRLIRTVDVGSESFPALSDLDGDGDLDLLVSNKIDTENNRTGHLYVFENTGSATAPAFAARGAVPGLPEQYHYAPAFGDLDGDGDDDMLLGSWQRPTSSYYRNDGPGGWRRVGFCLAGRWSIPPLPRSPGDATRRPHAGRPGRRRRPRPSRRRVVRRAELLPQRRRPPRTRLPARLGRVPGHRHRAPQRPHPRRSGRGRRPGSRRGLRRFRGRAAVPQRGHATGAGLRGDRDPFAAPSPAHLPRRFRGP